jgi:hypothetical protein
MSDKDALHERGRALEEEYFRRKNRELIEKMRLEARRDEARRDMGAQTGLEDPETLRQLQTLGFTPETVVLLPLVPVVQVAWADGEVADAERSAIFKVARARGIAEGSAAYHQLAAWLSDRPAPQVFSSATRLIREMLDAPGQDQARISADDLVAYCETIAAASGGLFGINRISAEERALLTSLAAELKTRGA